MFISSAADGSLVLTKAGYVLTVVILLALLAVAGISAGRRRKDPKEAKGAKDTKGAKGAKDAQGTKGAPDAGRGTAHMSARRISFCGISIALACVLSMVKLYEFPFGGSVTAFSMLFAVLPGWFFGLRTGLAAAAAYGVLQFLLGPYILFPLQVLVDYLFAFMALGLSGLFCHAQRGLEKGYLTGVLGRYFFAVLSGWLFFGEYAWEGWSALPYSLAYNAAYIFTEGAVTLLILHIPAVRSVLTRIRAMALTP